MAQEQTLERIFESALHTPNTKGVILLDPSYFCIGCRGELSESDASIIADLLSSAGVADAGETTGEIAYGSDGRVLQFHYAQTHILALLRATGRAPPQSKGDSPVSKSLGSTTIGSAGTGRTIKTYGTFVRGT